MENKSKISFLRFSFDSEKIMLDGVQNFIFLTTPKFFLNFGVEDIVPIGN